jgi:uncharacterized membrane protein HdeD (DUF308 family)
MLAQPSPHSWWILILRGIAAILFGVVAFIWPGLTGLVLVIGFGVYALVDGVFALITGISRLGHTSRGWAFILEGVLGIAMGLVALFWPGLTAIALIYLIAAWAVVTGIFEIVSAIQLRKEITNEWALGLSGALSIVFGVLLMFQPGTGGLTLVWILAGYAIAFGVLLIVAGLRLRGTRALTTRDTQPARPVGGPALRS